MKIYHIQTLIDVRVATCHTHINEKKRENNVLNKEEDRGKGKRERERKKERKKEEHET